MLNAVNATASFSNFEMKNQIAVLSPEGRAVRTLSVRELESIRTERPLIPASKHGLETICGASCETGAQ